MATIDIDIDMSVLKRKLKATEDKIKQGVENGLRELASEMKQMEQDIIDDNDNIGGDGTYKRTGRLKSSITIMPIKWSNGIAEISVVPKGYGDIPLFNEFGTGIYASDGNGREDGWVYQIAPNEFRFTRGLPPKYYVRDTRDFYEDKAITFIEKNIQRLL